MLLKKEKAHRNAEGKAHNGKWDDLRTCHMRMHLKLIKKQMRVIKKKGLPCLLPEQRGTMPGHMPPIPAKSGIRHPGRILSRGIGTPRTVLALPPS